VCRSLSLSLQLRCLARTPRAASSASPLYLPQWVARFCAPSAWRFRVKPIIRAKPTADAAGSFRYKHLNYGLHFGPTLDSFSGGPTPFRPARQFSARNRTNPATQPKQPTRHGHRLHLRCHHLIGLKFWRAMPIPVLDAASLQHPTPLCGDSSKNVGNALSTAMVVYMFLAPP